MKWGLVKCILLLLIFLVNYLCLVSIYFENLMWWNYYEMRLFVKVFLFSWCRKIRLLLMIGFFFFVIVYVCGLWMMLFIFVLKVEWLYCFKIDFLLFLSVFFFVWVFCKFILVFFFVECNYYFCNKDRILFFFINSVGMYCWNIRMVKREILFVLFNSSFVV